MLDLTVLKDLWTEDGAREVFARLVTHCVRSNYDDARTIRPNPGDEGIDVVSGKTKNSPKIWQSKYFPDSVGNSQKAQIRKSFKSSIDSDEVGKMSLWTLCIPIELDVAENKWWDNWSTKMMKENKGLTISLWTRTDFEAFSAKPELKPLFDMALKRNNYSGTLEHLLDQLNPDRIHLETPDDTRQYDDSIFVKKLEDASVTINRMARVAFYNFELLRLKIEQGGSAQEKGELADLRERVYALWEAEYNKAGENKLGKVFYNSMVDSVKQLDRTELASQLKINYLQKVGILHEWADLCEAGWTHDFKEKYREDDDA